MMDTLRTMIIQEPHHFLLLSRTKQELLVDKMVQRMVSSATFTDFINERRKVENQETKKGQTLELQTCQSRKRKNVHLAFWLSVLWILCRGCTQACSQRRSSVRWALWLRLWWMRFSSSWTAASSWRTSISSAASATAAVRWTWWLVSWRNQPPLGKSSHLQPDVCSAGDWRWWRLMFPCSSVKTWHRTTLSQVDRFLFFLPESKLQELSPVSFLAVSFDRQRYIFNCWADAVNFKDLFQ